MPKVTWRCTSSFPKSLDTIYGGGRDVRQVRRARRPTASSRSRSSRPARSSPGLQAADAVGRRHRRDVPHRLLLLLSARTRPSRFGTAVPFGLNARQQNAWLYYGGGNELLNEFYAKQGHRIGLPGGNTGAQMGGWFRKEINDGRRPQGPEDAHRRPRRQGHARSSASCRSRSPAATSIRRWRRARSTRPNGSAPTTTRSSASTRSRRTTTIPGWWEGGPAIHFIVNHDKWNELPKSYQAIARRGRAAANSDMMRRATTPRTRRRSSDWSAGGAQLRPFSQEILEACFEAAKEIYAEITAKNADVQEDLRQP